jgi:hypothetical protein
MRKGCSRIAENEALGLNTELAEAIARVSFHEANRRCLPKPG